MDIYYVPNFQTQYRLDSNREDMRIFICPERMQTTIKNNEIKSMEPMANRGSSKKATKM